MFPPRAALGLNSIRDLRVPHTQSPCADSEAAATAAASALAATATEAALSDKSRQLKGDPEVPSAKAKQRQKRKNRAKVMRKPRLMFAAPRQPNKNSSCSRKERGTDWHRVGNEGSVGERGAEEQLSGRYWDRGSPARAVIATQQEGSEAAARIWIWTVAPSLCSRSFSLCLSAMLALWVGSSLGHVYKLKVCNHISHVAREPEDSDLDLDLDLDWDDCVAALSPDVDFGRSFVSLRPPHTSLALPLSLWQLVRVSHDRDR